MTQQEINEFIRVAKSWVGYKEKASCNYATYEWIDGNVGRANFTRFGRIADMVMQGEDKRNKDGFPWCAMFIISCLYESKVGRINTTMDKLQPIPEGIKFVSDVLGGSYFSLKHMAGVANIYRAGVYLNKIGQRPSVGDFVIYIDENERPYHIGIVIGVSHSEIETIEGNTSYSGTGINPNGGQVAQKKRAINKRTLFFKNY